jgi:CDP-glucose 4,6-dehydratase
MEAMTMNRATLNNQFRGKSVFVTGHTGFKGSWLSIWLHQLGAKVSGYALEPATSPSNFNVSCVRDVVDQHVVGDVRSVDTLRKSLDAADPDIIFHLAAQPIVRESYRNPYETFDTNFMGSCNLLEAVRLRRKQCVVVMVTSDKCYENLGSHRGYREDDPMGGYDPYSASKGAIELLVSSYRRSFFPPAQVSQHGVKLASVRAGNVIGGGDWASDRIVPDIVAHLNAKRAVPLRYPRAVRPWQHVLAPLNGYLVLASKMLSSNDAELCTGWNFGPTDAGTSSVSELVDEFCTAWGSGSWEDVSDINQPYEDGMLRLSIAKAAKLGWAPVWTLRQTVEHTARWYLAFNASGGRSMLDVCLADIADYASDLAGAQQTVRPKRSARLAA